MSFASACIASSEPIFCFYINRTSETQIGRFVDSLTQKPDRLIRPNEHLLFEAIPSEVLEIHQFTSGGMALFQSLSCKELRVSNDLIENMLHWLS